MIVGISIPSLFAVLGALITYTYVNDIKEKQSEIDRNVETRYSDTQDLREALDSYFNSRHYDEE